MTTIEIRRLRDHATTRNLAYVVLSADEDDKPRLYFPTGADRSEQEFARHVFTREGLLACCRQAQSTAEATGRLLANYYRQKHRRREGDERVRRYAAQVQMAMAFLRGGPVEVEFGGTEMGGWGEGIAMAISTMKNIEAEASMALKHYSMPDAPMVVDDENYDYKAEDDLAVLRRTRIEESAS